MRKRFLYTSIVKGLIRKVNDMHDVKKQQGLVLYFVYGFGKALPYRLVETLYAGGEYRQIGIMRHSL
ncbi:hypothetical protein [Streptococcus cuniculi]|uniref:hypothetical protein n=1 Tax=Streptococcus cuniculi TaxID=1432788 RepID=UPI0018835A90|nr:hypothetical protein [Streptococcus cuniculi]